MFAAGGLQIAAEAAVADERLVALCELAAERLQDSGALLGIAAGLGEIAADDIAALADLDRLGFQFGECTAAAWHGERHERRRISDTVRVTSALLRSRTPRMYSSWRCSRAAMVGALIMPRSATTHMRPTPKRARSRSTTGSRVVTSAVLPGHSSQHSGRPS